MARPRRKKPAEKPAEKNSFTVRTDVVITAGTPHFYGDKVKLTAEEARPLLREGRVEKA